MALPLSALRVLLAALEESCSCFVLGAGVSAPIVPLGAQLSILVQERILTVGAFPAVPLPRDEVSDRILGPARAWEGLDDFTVRDELVRHHLAPSAVRAAAVALLRPDPPQWAPQYQVFNLSRHRLFLINFNVDSLADHYCSRHAIVNVHGTSLSAQERCRIQWESVVDALQRYPGLREIRMPGLLLPQREPSEIASADVYVLAGKFLSATERLFLVGYSFGDLDDHIAYELVMSIIRSRRIPCVVVSPRPGDLVLRISADAKAADVAPLPVYWDSLSAAIICSRAQAKWKTCDHRRFCLRCIAYLYEVLLKSGNTRHSISD